MEAASQKQQTAEQGHERQRLHTLEIVVSEMDTQLHHLQALMQIMTAQQGGEDQELQPAEGRGGNVMRDEVWACDNCAARLGIYNSERDELRVRYKDFVAYVQPGVGGKIMVPCRRCGEQNTLSDTRKGMR